MTTLSRPGGAAAAAIRGVLLGRVAAVLALVSAGLHLLLVDASSLGSFAMLAMALACLPCAWHLWRRPTSGVWWTTAALDAAMLLVHGQMLVGSARMGAMPGMGHGGASSGLVALGLGTVGAQLGVAAVAGLRALAARSSVPLPES